MCNTNSTDSVQDIASFVTTGETVKDQHAQGALQSHEDGTAGNCEHRSMRVQCVAVLTTEVIGPRRMARFTA